MPNQITNLTLLSGITSRKKFCISSGKIAGADISDLALLSALNALSVLSFLSMNIKYHKLQVYHLNNINKLNLIKGDKAMKEKIYFPFVRSIPVLLIFTCLTFFTKNLTAQQTDKWHPASAEDLFGSENTVLYVALGAITAGLAIWCFAIIDSGKDEIEKGKSDYKKIDNGIDSPSMVISDSFSTTK